MTIAAYGRFTEAGIAKLAAQRAKAIEAECRAVQSESEPVVVPVAERVCEPARGPEKVIAFPLPDVLQLMRRRGMPLWARHIVVTVAEKHGVGISDIMSSSRSRSIVAVRNEVFYLIHTNPSPTIGAIPSYPQIAGWFGREHTGVLYGAAKHASDNGLPFASSFDAEDKMARKRIAALRWWEKQRGAR